MTSEHGATMSDIEFTLHDLDDAGGAHVVTRTAHGTVLLPPIAGDPVRVTLRGAAHETSYRGADTAIEILLWLCGGRVEVEIFDNRRARRGEDPTIMVRLPAKAAGAIEIMRTDKEQQ